MQDINKMTSSTSFINNEVVAGEVEYPVNDPASGAFFQPDYKKNEDLKQMLDGSKDSLKLEAMKRIIGMIAKGRDASDLFPAVVKNVVSKNIEVKKLVYVYLVRYAEEQQDLALLSISTFQRALKDPNQLIRASALRVLSSIRVTMIVPIVMLAIRDSASDMSPYVRKTAAHAIPKLYSLDPEQKEELVSIIDKLLSDKAPLVVGSAAMAFSEVCPDRMSLIHKSYRKLCSLLADVDEWGQLTLLNVLTVYARTCFPDPNEETYSSESESDLEVDSDSATGRKRSPASLDPDHRLLLRAAKPLLQSRNAGVVMAVAQLFYHCGPAQELPPIAKALIRLLRAPLEVQSVVLNAIASITVTRRSLFEPFLKSFFVRNSDPTHIKLLKLEILTNLATEASASVVLREFQTYVTSSDKSCAAHTIQAIGRLAVTIPAETETCLNGLLHLLSSKDEWVVCEAVVVVKRVVGGGAASARAAVARAAKLLRTDRLASNACAAAVWLVAEHGAKHPRAAAVLAHMAANFADQDELVKLQLLSLAVKLSITQPDTVPVCRYVLSLARYDASYDVRDRARLLRRFVDARGSQLAMFAADIFRPDKPKPTVESSFKDRQQYTVGTLSQYCGCSAGGYRGLPPAPRATLHAALRDQPEPPAPRPQTRSHTTPKNKTFYSEPESSGSGSESSGAESSSEDSSEEEGEESTNEEKKQEKPVKQTNNYRSSNSASSDSDSDTEESSSSSGSDSESEESSEESPKKSTVTNDKATTQQPESKKSEEQKKVDKSNLELLLELDEVASTLPTMTPTCGGFLSPPPGAGGGLAGVEDEDSIRPTGPSLVPAGSTSLVARVVSGGLHATRRWSRAPHLYSHAMCALDILFTNHTSNPITDLTLRHKNVSGKQAVHAFPPIPCLPGGATVQVTLGVDFADTIQPVEFTVLSSLVPFPPIPCLPGGATVQVTLGVDFADTIQPVEFTVLSSLGEVPVSITPPVGELMRAVTMSETRWDVEHRRLRGMTECSKSAAKLEDEAAICKRVFETANLAAVTATGPLLRFAGRMMSSQDLVLLSVKVEPDSVLVTGNCPNMAVASMLANEVAQAFARP